MKILKSATLVIALGCLLLASTGASADLIDQGDTTLDDVTNREWLDLTVTQAQNLSVNQFLADQGGWITAGFKLANVEEVQDLLGPRNLFDPFPDDTGFVPPSPGAPQMAAVNMALLLFGETDGGSSPFGEALAEDTLGLSFTGLCQPFYQKVNSSVRLELVVIVYRPVLVRMTHRIQRVLALAYGPTET